MTRLRITIRTSIIVFLLIGCISNAELAVPVQMASLTPYFASTSASSVVESVAKATPTLPGLASRTERPTHLDQMKSFSQIMPTAANTWYGIRQVSTDDMQTVADNLGGTVIGMGVGTQTADQINIRLDQAQSLGYRAVVIMYTEETCSRRPWEWNGSEWQFPQSTIETLQGIAQHPAIFAIYALHEPFDTTNECHWTVEQQQELYQLLKGYTDGLPVWSDVTGLAYWEQGGVELTDGICDYCGTSRHRFRSDWTSERCLGETLDWIDADLDTQQRLMSNSQAVFHIQTFSYPGYTIPLRLPTPEELTIVRDHLCALDQPMMYYPWSHGLYDSTLKDAPPLWPVVAEGCNHTTYTPQAYLPYMARGSASSILIDHNCTAADTIPQSWLDQARNLDTFFAHKSIGSNIMDGFDDLESQNWTRYHIETTYNSSASWFGDHSGILENTTFGTNLYPLTKISGFDDLIRNSGYHTADVAMMKFCYGDLPPWADESSALVWQEYRDMMLGLEADYPDTIFVWWTIPLVGSSWNTGNDEKAVFNGLVRDYCATHNRVLFDFADIESHDPDGNPITGSDGSEAAWEGYTYDKKHLNETGRQRMASAMWWLLARIAGWTE